MSTSSGDNGDPSQRIDHAVVILAAGRGSRMKSATPKVLHPLAGAPMVVHVHRAAQSTSPLDTIITVGPETERARNYFPQDTTFAVQETPDGTAGAVRDALDAIPGDAAWLLVLNGDVPLVTEGLLNRLLNETRASRPLIALLTFPLDDPGLYGRVVIEGGQVARVVEAADDDGSLPRPATINSGIYCFDLAWLRERLPEVPRSASGEYYLTALIEAAASEGDSLGRPGAIAVEGDPASLIGVDDRVRLAEAEATLRHRILMEHMQAGVTVVDPGNCYVDLGVRISHDARLEPGAILRGATAIGEGSVIGPYTVVEDSEIGAGCRIMQSTVEGAVVGDGVRVGPYSHLRAGTVIEPGVHIGNYVETKNATLMVGARAGHFSYLGDAEVGRGVNVGAGTITCNFDGVNKHQTTIGDGAFIGSDTLLIAPVELGEGARTGAGAVVNRDVEPGATVVGMPARAIGTRKRVSRTRDDDS
ncbi:MAG: bifunctional UDP-N-acetylglucosamine diphosphorylase/glucosamine-1-phosphate N-acetyltransferase GlmU [Chloroflexota bacterium]